MSNIQKMDLRDDMSDPLPVRDDTEILFDPKKDYKKDWHWWDYLESWWYRYFWNWFEAIPRNTKHFIQRGMFGWAPCDVWEMHHYLTDVILNMLVALKRDKHGHPSTLDEQTGSFDYDMERWDKILQEMIDGFLILKRADSYDEMLNYAPEFPEENRLSMEKSMQEKYPKWRFTTKEENAQVTRAFELFAKYFTSLWD